MANIYSKTTKTIALITLIAFSFIQVGYACHPKPNSNSKQELRRVEGFLRGEQARHARSVGDDIASVMGANNAIPVEPSDARVGGGNVDQAQMVQKLIELGSKTAQANNEETVKDNLTLAVRSILGPVTLKYYSVQEDDDGNILIKNIINAGDRYESRSVDYRTDKGEQGNILKYFQKRIYQGADREKLFLHIKDRRLPYILGGFGYWITRYKIFGAIFNTFTESGTARNINGMDYEQMALFFDDTMRYSQIGFVRDKLRPFFIRTRQWLGSRWSWCADKLFVVACYIAAETIMRRKWGVRVKELFYMPVLDPDKRIIGLVLIHNWNVPQPQSRPLLDDRDKDKNIGFIIDSIDVASFTFSNIRLRQDLEEMEKLFLARHLMHDINNKYVPITGFYRLILNATMSIYKDIESGKPEEIKKVEEKFSALQRAESVAKDIMSKISTGATINKRYRSLDLEMSKMVESIVAGEHQEDVLTLIHRFLSAIFTVHSLEALGEIGAKLAELSERDPNIASLIEPFLENKKDYLNGIQELNDFSVEKLEQARKMLVVSAAEMDKTVTFLEEFVRWAKSWLEEVSGKPGFKAIDDSMRLKISNMSRDLDIIKEESIVLKSLLEKLGKIDFLNPMNIQIWEHKEINGKDLDVEIWAAYKIIAGLANDEGIKTTIKGRDIPFEVKINVDKYMLFSVMENFLINARNYSKPMPQSGQSEQPRHIDVVIKITERSVEGDVKKQYLHVDVSDTGIGIPDKFKADIGKIGVRADVDKRYGKEGTGTGIHGIIKDVESVGGNFGFTSEENIGSDFWFELPLLENLPQEAVEKYNQQSTVSATGVAAEKSPNNVSFQNRLRSYLKDNNFPTPVSLFDMLIELVARQDGKETEEVYRRFSRARIVDVGCGIKHYLVDCLQYIYGESAEVYGIDPALPAGSEFLIADKAQNIASYFGEDSVDLAISTGFLTIDYLDNKAAYGEILRQLLKVLKPGGEVIITGGFFKNPLLENTAKEIEAVARPGDKYFYLRKLSSKTLNNYRLQVLKCLLDKVAVIISDESPVVPISTIRENLIYERGLKPSNIISVKLAEGHNIADVVNQLEMQRQRGMDTDNLWIINNTKGRQRLSSDVLSAVMSGTVFVPDELFDEEVFQKKIEAASTGAAA